MPRLLRQGHARLSGSLVAQLRAAKMRADGLGVAVRPTILPKGLAEFADPRASLPSLPHFRYNGDVVRFFPSVGA